MFVNSRLILKIQYNHILSSNTIKNKIIFKLKVELINKYYSIAKKASINAIIISDAF